MARRTSTRDFSSILAAAEHWITSCLIADGSIFSREARWTAALVEEVYQAFVKHPDFGSDSFMAKLQGQLRTTSPPAQQLAAEILWSLLLFPSNMNAPTKRQQVRDIWALSGQQIPEGLPSLDEDVLLGVGSGGPGFNTYRPDELAFLITIALDLKRRHEAERRDILLNYDRFMKWIDAVPQRGQRQFRHMLRFFAFPDRVERISSNNDRRKILEAFSVASWRETGSWSDRELDAALMTLRAKLQEEHLSDALDFYEPPLRERWAQDRKIKTLQGEVTVTVPEDDEEQEQVSALEVGIRSPEARQSFQIQAKLAEIGAIMGFKIWTPRGDRTRIKELVPASVATAFVDDLFLSYDLTTIATIEQIDILWLRGRSIARAFEVEHTTAVYSGLLRMADLLALQPNMDIRLHIVAPDERREKVFREMLRPVFTLLDRGPLSRSCTFISYEGVNAIRNLGHLAHTSDSIIAEYEEKAEP